MKEHCKGSALKRINRSFFADKQLLPWKEQRLLPPESTQQPELCNKPWQVGQYRKVPV